VHELSIAYAVVEAAAAAAAQAGGVRVLETRLLVGALSGVVPGALEFCWQIATAGTPLEGSRLTCIAQPVAVFCPSCGEESDLPGVQSFRCPLCGRPTGDVRRGRELQIESLEIETAACENEAAPAISSPRGHRDHTHRRDPSERPQQERPAGTAAP
jgi:hydrogenase nickel incorporation protein HypA/HybF